MKRGGRRAQPPLGLILQILVGSLLLIGAPAASAEGCLPWRLQECKRFDAGGVVTSEWALGTSDGDSQKLDIDLEPWLEVELSRNFSLEAAVRLRTDAFDRLEPGRPEQRTRSVLSKRLLIGDHAEIELRELFVEGRVGRLDLTVGKQQIVWGKADGLKVLDVVNPQTFREFILEDFDASRIPLWSVNAEIPVGDVVTQLIWIPDPTFNEFTDGVYAFSSPLIVPPGPAGVAVEVRPLERPKNLVVDSDAGIRLSTFKGGWDLSLNYFYHYHDAPVPFRRLELSGGPPRAVIEPRYKRVHLIGGSFSNAFGDLTVRAEMGIFFDRYVPTVDLLDSDGAVRTNDASYVVGLDWSSFDETLLSVQLFQSVITDRPRGVQRDRVESSITMLARREFWNDTLAVEALWIHSLNRGDGFARGRVSYEIRDGLRAWVGYDGFYGDADGIFGQFDENDRIAIGLEWAL